MNDVSQPTIYKNGRMWKTLDDVNATLDSLSLINRGQPTTSGLNATLNKITSNNLGYESVCGSETLNNAVNNSEQAKSASSGYTLGRGAFIKQLARLRAPADKDAALKAEIDKEKCATRGYTLGRGAFIKQLARLRAPADKDAALKAELDKIFSVDFSNEAIEKRWNHVEKVEKDQFEDELIELENNIRFEPIEQFMQKEIEARSCSPPAEFTTDMKSSHDSPPSTQQESGIVVIEPISDNRLNNLECMTSDDDSEQRQSLSPTNVVIEENVAAQLPVLRPKKCRNALLNGLDRRMALFGKDMKEIKQSIVLKTPSDFLVPPANNGSSQKCFSYRMQQQSKHHQQNFDSSFEYCEDDFPTI